MEKWVLILVLSVCLTIGVFGQNPGNVGTANLTAWFKPDNLVLGNVTNWTTEFPTGAGAISVTDNIAPYPIATNIPMGDVSNYNTTIEFTANSQTALKALENTSSLNLLDNASSTGHGTFFGVYYVPVATQNDHMMLYNESFSDAIQFRNLGANGRLAIGLTGLSTRGTRNWVENFTPTIISYKGNKSTANSMTAYQNSRVFTTASGSQSSGPTGLYFGFHPSSIATSPYNGYLHEFIFYNTDLSQVDINKVHSYLAVKYGITLDNIGGGTQGDYLSTAGTVIWDASISPMYHNDVIGIGRDDDQDLLQKQSHSFDDVTRIYVGTLNATNVGNTGTITANSSYALIGDNAGQVCSTPASNLEVPASPFINARLEREWKITKTNFLEDISIDITLDACATASNFNVNCIALMVDDDGDFTNSTVYTAADGISFSQVGNTITVSGITTTHLPNDSTYYLTLGSVFLQEELTDTLKCKADSVVLDAGYSGATFLWNNGITTQTNNVNDTGLYWVDITSIGCSLRDSIIVIDQEVIASFFTLDTTGCFPLTSDFTDLSSIDTGVITSWSWDFGDGNTSINQNPSHVYSAAGVYSVTLTVTSDIGCVDDSIKVGYIDVYDFAIADFSFYPSFGAPQDIIEFLNLSSNTVSYKWYFGDGDSSMIANPTHKYTDVGVFEIELIAINVNGCNDTITYSISINSDDFYAPNTFTPGEDGNNDEWKLLGVTNVSEFKLLIFNRWGEVVFETADETKSWDGKYKGGDCPSDVYVWKVSFKGGEGDIIEKIGHINLLR